MMNLVPPIKKIFNAPILPVNGSWIDAFIFLAIFILLFAAVFSIRVARGREKLRALIRVISFFVIGFLFFARICLVKTTASSFWRIGWDDLSAFGNFYIFVLVAGFVLIMGNFYCGWLCPLGVLQDAAQRVFSLKTKSSKVLFWLFILLLSILLLNIAKPANDFFTENIIALWSLVLLAIILIKLMNPGSEGYLMNIRYFSLAGYILVTGVGVWFGDAWCWLAEGELDYSSLIGFLVIFLSAIIIPFAWCRYLCPTGAMLFVLGKRSLLKIAPGCRDGCKRSCLDVCPIGAKGKKRIDYSLCTYCGRCIDRCGSKYPDDKKD